MKSSIRMSGVAGAILGLLAGGLPAVLAQTANDFVLDQFGDDSGVFQWSRAYGISPTFEWDPEANSEVSNPQGAMKVTVPFDLVTYQGDNQTAFQRSFGETIDFAQYQNVHFDVKVDESSSRLSTSWGAGQFGGINVIVRNNDWSVQIDTITTSDPWLGSGDYGVWRHFTLPVDQTLDNDHSLTAMMLQIWSGWVEADKVTGGHTNTVTFWLDNVYLEKKTNAIPVPPPTLSTRPATGGLQLLASQAGSQWQRQGIRTVAGDKSWVDASGPVSYELTIKKGPRKNGFQAHLFLIPNSTGDNAPDWNRPDAIFVPIYDNGAGGGSMAFGFKTNQPSGNSQVYGANHLADVGSSVLEGTWRLTFNSNTSITMTSPDGSATNFVMDAAAVAKFANPVTAYFGAQPNNLDWIGSGFVFERVRISGVAAPIDESFGGPALDTEVWAMASDDAAGVFIAPADAKAYLTWTLPAVAFVPQAGAAVNSGPWQDLDLARSFRNGTNQTLLLAASGLPAGDKFFMRMLKRPFEKLQVLLPGETAAPGTPTGKTGAPLVQTAGVAFDVIVNAVDARWSPAPVGRDTLTVSSSDASATLPADAALASGTRTFSVTLNDVGSFTITVSDVTDPSIPAATSSPVTVQW